jgi:hypothetical protein
VALPAGAPRPIVERLSSEIERLLTAQAVTDRYAALGADILFMPPARFAQYVRAKIEKWGVYPRLIGGFSSLRQSLATVLRNDIKYTYTTYKRDIFMPQLHFYVPDAVAEQIKRRAAHAGQPVSRYVAELVMRDAGEGWPAGYFENITGLSQEEAIPYEPSGPPEERLPLK